MNGVLFKKETHQYFVKETEYPSVTTIIKHFGFYPDYDQFGNESARLFGDVLHDVLRLYDKGVLDCYDYDRDVLYPYIRGYKKWLDHYKPVWELIEEPLYSNVWRFAGIPDRVGKVDGQTWEVDFKSGLSIPAHELQHAGYQVMIEENLKVRVHKRYSLIILPDDFRLIPKADPCARSVFLGLVQAYTWGRKRGLII